MQVAIMGAGAVGCYYGAMLARAGHAVTLIGRQALVDQVAAGGLRLEMADFDDRVALGASTEPSALADAEVVLFCVKSSDTEAAGEAIRPHLRPDATIFSFQNGVDNATRLSGVLGRPAVPAVVYVAAGIPAPGHVKHHGRGDIVVGTGDRVEAIAAGFRAAGIPTTVSDAVETVLWGKLVTNCAHNALSAVAQVSYGHMVAVPGVTDVMADAVDECLAVARGLGIGLDDGVKAMVLGVAASMPGQYSSTAQDMARGKPTEIDHLNGYVVRKGQALGIPTPVNRALWAMVKLQESRRPA
ncbi:ketopantoate reductase [Stella humosa]|uniref:2-dehydropantoate 2-reductase n=1 Tax=Stella humosa TaxID=94 RepID=A0A3N1KVE0_9PROT|nr:ketopantoate reductase family protein [Stella humosa]ROP84551.1 ketopantoate reductase [Stella humosa]BBK34071.1 2-dehydropantoate 2-reductase [Stella humosa]